mgnify:CR=1 FL=1
MEEPRVGVYICECGVNIADTVDVPAVVGFIWPALDRTPAGGTFQKGRIKVHSFDELLAEIRGLPLDGSGLRLADVADVEYSYPRQEEFNFLNGTEAVIAVPGGTSHDVWSAGNFAPRLMQTAADTDFELEVKFESTVSLPYQEQGVSIPG